MAIGVAGCGSSVVAGPEPNLTAAQKIREDFNAAAASKGGKAAGGAAAGEPELKRLDGWATLKGRFVLDGTIRRRCREWTP